MMNIVELSGFHDFRFQYPLELVTAFRGHLHGSGIRRQYRRNQFFKSQVDEAMVRHLFQRRGRHAANPPPQPIAPTTLARFLFKQVM
jgi:hypothetical protein